jgi:ATP-dependent Lon protease
MPSYTDEEKIAIGKNYMLPRILQESGVPPDKIVINEEVWPQIVRPLGFDAGIRTLQRTINTIVRKLARQMVQGEIQSLILSQDNIKHYITQ